MSARADAKDDDAPEHEVEFAPGPLGLEFEPEVVDAAGAELGCMVARAGAPSSLGRPVRW